MGISLEKKQAALKTGELGEQLACDFLVKRGYKTIARNLKNNLGRRLGEIDIVALKDGELVFVEVKTTRESPYNYSLPEERINAAKILKLSKIAQTYVRNNNLWHLPYRFDAIAVTLKQETASASIRHLKNIFI